MRLSGDECQICAFTGGKTHKMCRLSPRRHRGDSRGTPRAFEGRCAEMHVNIRHSFMPQVVPLLRSAPEF